MAAQVLIELIPDVSQLSSTLDELNKSGGVDDTSAASFKAGNAEIEKRNKLLATQATAQAKIEQGEKKQIATLGQVQKAASAVAGTVVKMSGKEFAAAMQQQGKSAGQLINSLAGVTNEAKKQTVAEESLRLQKRKLTEEIAKLIAAGQAEGAAFQELIAQAGELDDAMGDANAAIRRAGSDTRGLDNLIMVAQGVTAGFTVATSAAALFGDESEETQKVLLKVNAAMSLLAGLQQIQAILRSEELKSMIASLTIQRARNAQIVIENGLHSRSVIVRGLATGAQWALNAAMSANPIGLVVVAISALVLAMKAYTDAAGEAASAAAAFNAAADPSGLNAEYEVYDTNLKKRLADMQAAGAKQSEMARAELGNLRLKGEAVAKDLANVRAALAANEEASEERQKAVEREIELTKMLNNINLEGYVKTRELQKAISDENKAAAEDAKKRAEEADRLAKATAEKARAAAMKAAEDRKAGAELALLNAESGSTFELEARIDIIEKTAEAELLNAELTANQRKVITTKAERDIAELRKKYRDDAFAADLKAAQETLDQIERIRLNQLDREAQDITKSESARFKATQAVRQEELSQIEGRQQRLDDLYAKGAITYHEYEMQKTELLEQEDQKRFEILQAGAAREKAIRQAIAQEAFNVASQAAAAVFEVGKAQRDAELENALNNLNKEKEAALATKNLTESQKSAIQKKYDNETRRLKNEAARKERAAARNQAIVNGLLAVTNALATVQPFWAAIIAAAGAAVTTGLQVAKINATPLPAYAVGTDSAKRGYALVGEKGPEIVEFAGGEKVWTATQSEKMMKEWNAANHTASIAEYRANHSGGIDYDKLAKALAKEIKIPAPLNVHNSVDKDGVTTYLLSENSKRTFKNQRNRFG